jgi:FkbM family methyltransferase
MEATIKALTGDFTILDLGAASAAELSELRPFRSALTLIELDAVAAVTTTPSEYYRKIALQAAIASQPGRRTFYQRKFPQSSSFLPAKMDLVAAYGLQALFEVEKTFDIECETLSSVFNANNIQRVDFLKTDLEGLDYEILASTPDMVRQSLVIQCEVRFQPLFVGEPDFVTIAAYLASLGFELIMLRPEVWKYATQRRNCMRDGRMVWADAIFFNSEEQLSSLFQDKLPLVRLKQVILAQALGLHSHAQYLFERTLGQLPMDIQHEMADYLAKNTKASQLLVQAVNRLASVPGGGRIVWSLRRSSLALARALTIHRNLRHIAPPF